MEILSALLIYIFFLHMCVKTINLMSIMLSMCVNVYGPFHTDKNREKHKRKAPLSASI